MNQFIGMGNLTSDPELRVTQNNLKVCEFSIAINEGSGDHKTTEYVNCVCWRNLAENLTKYKRKGDPILIQGKIKTDKYKKDGQTRYRTYILTSNIEFINTKRPDIMQESVEPIFEEIPEEKDEPLDFSGDNLPFY